MNEKVQKCFYCGKEAIAICDSCSPTCATGLTPEKPLCEDCIVSGVAINIVRLLIPKRDAMEKIREAQKRKEERNQKYKRSRGEIHLREPQKLKKII